ncbi:hypothetical protein FM037_08105 [Shewanella psychropiezotolerans]|uniref:Orphan protein n=1 Tax=Shewanella psychropiezotolerans TaxID=2593655 RepID=A0ABX5WVS3_9GAMM|nr:MULTISPECIES: hypothetical protein [Shewanella]MPY22490.1 hypothetical protein [Shewanella sp. YLB-07]QDO83195.1 hypothetical protein FM037_08105 [Shewanella psychropiezotolerans]
MNTANLLSRDELAMFADLFSVDNITDANHSDVNQQIDLKDYSSDSSELLIDNIDRWSNLMALGNVLSEVKEDVTDPNKVANGIQLAIEIYNTIINKDLVNPLQV